VAGIRGVRSARCKCWSRLQNSTLHCHQEQICRRSDGQLLTLLYVLTVEIYDILSCTWYSPSVFSSTLSTASHSVKCRLLNLHYHGVVLSCTCIFIRCCLQYFKQELFFRHWTGFYFFLYRGTKGTPLDSKCDKHIFTASQNTRLPDILCTPDSY